MNNISDFTRCANCGACYNACPADAITVRDGMFYELQVDETKCISCGLCKKVCPVNAPEAVQQPVKAYAAIGNDPDVVKNSSSGGVFSILADGILKQDGVVFGAAYTDHCRQVELRSTQEVSLEELRRSKYVESLPGLSYRKVKEILEQGRPVLYCGAPCQIAGLKRFLRKDYEKLITCDFSCGGMPSNKLYRQYLEGVGKKLGASVCKVNFRPKLYGWQNYAIKLQTSNGRVYKKLAQSDPFFYCFLYNRYTVRDYCYECEFADNHYSDLILADFWKYKSISQVENNMNGISLVVSNSEKGDRFLLQNAKEMALTVLDLQEGSYNLQKRTKDDAFMKRRSEFLQECENKGFLQTMKKVKLSKAYKFRLKYAIKKCLGKTN